MSRNVHISANVAYVIWSAWLATASRCSNC